MRVEAENGVVGLAREAVANSMLGMATATQPPSSEDAKLASRYVTGGWRLAEQMQQAAEQGDAERFIDQYQRLVSLREIAGDAWERSHQAFAAVAVAQRFRPTCDSLAYASAHHALRAETLTTLLAVFFCTLEDATDAAQDAVVSSDQIREHWQTIVKALQQQPIAFAQQAEVGAARELAEIGRTEVGRPKGRKPSPAVRERRNKVREIYSGGTTKPAAIADQFGSDVTAQTISQDLNALRKSGLIQ